MSDPAKEWMLGLHGHEDLVGIEEVLRLVRGGQLRGTDMIRRVGEPWRAVAEIPELAAHLAVPAERPASGRFARPSEKTARFRHSAPGRNEGRPEPPGRPTPRPGFESLSARYFSPTDLMRAMTYVFQPSKLLLAAILLVPAWIAFSATRHAASRVLQAAGLMAAVVACCAAAIALCYMTRRQVEGIPPRWREGVRHLLRNLGAALLLPLFAAVSLGIPMAALAAVASAGRSSETLTAVLRHAYLVPFLVGLLVVGVGTLFGLALMTVTPGLAVEGGSLRDAVRTSLYYARTQGGRLLLHGFVVAIACAATWHACAWSLGLAHALPGVVGIGMGNIPAFTRAVTEGMRDGLALAIPASVFATMSVLSYLILRQEDVVYSTDGEGREETRVSDETPVG
ncbi:MAG: hypothetical protein HYY17_16735 [Planctomycetes bacterium]|nr:hypothetical protein [Planctomycetota bacterium]